MREALRQLRSERGLLERLARCPVIGVTCAATGFRALRSQQFDILLLDECSQMIEPLSLLPLIPFGVRFVAAVGDPQQLPPALASAPSFVTRASTRARLQAADPALARDLELAIARENGDALRSSVEALTRTEGKEGDREGDGGQGHGERVANHEAVSAPSTLDRTLFERWSDAGLPRILLRTQYRCHPLLASLASRLFYRGALRDGVAAWQRGARLRGVAPLVVFDTALPPPSFASPSPPLTSSIPAVDEWRTPPAATDPFTGHLLPSRRSFEEQFSGGSCVNEGDAEVCAQLVAESLARGVAAEEVGVICLYRAQAAVVRTALRDLTRRWVVRIARCEAAAEVDLGGGHRTPAADPSVHHVGEMRTLRQRLLAAAQVQVSTVDAFQGGERDVVIVSTSRSRDRSLRGGSSGRTEAWEPNDAAAASGAHATDLRFIDHPARMNVAITRARRHLLIVGSQRVFRATRTWSAALDAAAKQPGGIRSPHDSVLLWPADTHTSRASMDPSDGGDGSQAERASGAISVAARGASDPTTVGATTNLTSVAEEDDGEWDAEGMAALLAAEAEWDRAHVEQEGQRSGEALETMEVKDAEPEDVANEVVDAVTHPVNGDDENADEVIKAEGGDGGVHDDAADEEDGDLHRDQDDQDDQDEDDEDGRADGDDVEEGEAPGDARGVTVEDVEPSSAEFDADEVEPADVGRFVVDAVDEGEEFF